MIISDIFRGKFKISKYIFACEIINQTTLSSATFGIFFSINKKYATRVSMLIDILQHVKCKLGLRILERKNAIVHLNACYIIGSA